jgi:proliferating cell nuclear antigen
VCNSILATMNEDNNVLTIKTVQIQPIRNLITAIKDILTDCTILFDGDGMKIINFDKSQTILVKVILHSRKFEQYNCKQKRILICANTVQLFRVISSISNEDTLSMYIDKDDFHDGIVSHLGLQYDNGNIKQCYSQKLRLIEPDTEEIPDIEVEYSTIINFPTTDFQKIIRDLNGVSDRIEITSVGKDITFSCEGTYASSKVHRTESEGNLNFKQNDDPSVIVQGEFSLKSLSQFIKCTPLCSHLEMYLGNDLPLIIKYDVASLGSISLALAPLPPS